MGCDTCDAECKEICEAACKSAADSRPVYEIDSTGNLCGCGSSCTAFCGASREGTSNTAKINYVSSVEVPDVSKVKYGDSDIYDNSKNKFT